MAKKSSNSSKKESARLLQPRPTRRSAQANLARIALIAFAAATLALPAGIVPGSALPVRTPPPDGATTSPEVPASTAANVLPVNSSVLFVLDQPISSASTRTGTFVRAHLKDALVVGGRTIAHAGTPGRIRILSASGAQPGDVYGYVDIYFMPLRLADGKELPLRAPTAHLTAHVTAGHESTVAAEDTIVDIVLPIHVIYQAMRRGRNFTLPAGSVIRARTVATVSVNARGTVAVETPSPLSAPAAPPASDFSVMPFATAPAPRPNVKPTPYVVPSPTPFVVESPTPYGVTPAPASTENPQPSQTPYVAPSPTPYHSPSP